MPRELLRATSHDRQRSLGWFAAAWMEHFTLHGPGDVQGDPVVLDDELAGFTVDSYALDPSGRRLYDSVFLSRAKVRAHRPVRAVRGVRTVPVRALGQGWRASEYSSRLQADMHHGREASVALSPTVWKGARPPAQTITIATTGGTCR